MTSAMPVHVAVVDASGTVPAGEPVAVAGALNQQVQCDFAPAWHVAATVGAYPEAPPDSWRIELRRDIPGGAVGYHADADHQPFSLIDVDAGRWTVTASHELLEMLADPFGNRLHTAHAPPGWAGASHRVRYLVEVCDPCQLSTYEVGGVEVSDFVLPSFYRSSDSGTGRQSQLGAITAPRQVVDGGYLTFLDPADQHFWQRRANDGAIVDEDWGVQELEGQMLRERADVLARAAVLGLGEKRLTGAAVEVQPGAAAAGVRYGPCRGGR
jgi:hypothetical protein